MEGEVVVQTRTLQEYKRADAPDPELGGPSSEFTPDMAEVIYIFANPNEPGIKFINHSPSGVVAELTGSNKPGVYTTTVDSIEIVKWDEDINQPNKTQIVLYRNGSGKVTTIMVSLKKLKEIVENIAKQMEAGKTEITIDINILIKVNSFKIDENIRGNIRNESKISTSRRELNNFKYEEKTDNYKSSEEKLDNYKFSDEDLDKVDILERYISLHEQLADVQEQIENIYDKSDVLNKFDDDVNDIGSSGKGAK